MNVRILLMVLFVVLIVYGIYTALNQPKPTVVRALPPPLPPQNATVPTQVATTGCNEIPYIKLWGTEICGGIIYSLEYNNDVYVLLVENVSVRGKVTLQNSACTIIPRFDGWVRLMCKSYIVVTR